MNVDKQYKHGLRERSKFFCEQRGQLYYIGGQKDNGEDMARCINCWEWFHHSCQKIPEAVFSDPSIK